MTALFVSGSRVTVNGSVSIINPQQAALFVGFEFRSL